MGKTIAELEGELSQIDADMQALCAEVPGLLIEQPDEPAASDRERRLAVIDWRRFVLYHRRQAVQVALRFAQAWGENWDVVGAENRKCPPVKQGGESHAERRPAG
jgi:hypothetical protein